MNLLKYTFLYTLLQGIAFYIIKQNTTPEEILQTDEIEGKPSPITAGSLGSQKDPGFLWVASSPVFVFRSLNT